jgi:hypothetical protein
MSVVERPPGVLTKRQLHRTFLCEGLLVSRPCVVIELGSTYTLIGVGAGEERKEMRLPMA